MGYFAEVYDIDIRVNNVPDQLLDELEELHFEFDIAEGGTFLNYINGNWRDIEEGLLKLAPYIVEPAFVIFQGEDKEIWKIEFDNNTATTYDSIVVYNTDPTNQVRY